jgi:hypothetical protein
MFYGNNNGYNVCCRNGVCFSGHRFSTPRGNKTGFCYLEGKTTKNILIIPTTTHLGTLHIYKKRETSAIKATDS